MRGEAVSEGVGSQGPWKNFLSQDYTLVNQGGLPGRGSGVSESLQLLSFFRHLNSQHLSVERGIRWALILWIGEWSHRSDLPSEAWAL